MKRLNSIRLKMIHLIMIHGIYIAYSNIHANPIMRHGMPLAYSKKRASPYMRRIKTLRLTIVICNSRAISI